jgi:hypothetical protein
MAGVYLQQGEDLVALAEAPYLTEAVLQELLGKNPALLAGDSASQAWVLIRKEAGIGLGDGGSTGSLDHVFLDGAGIPTLVEVKRSSDSRIRREVVGQMLDYAANAASAWSEDTLRKWWHDRCAQDDVDPEDTLLEALPGVGDAEEYWETVRTNLAAKRFRLVFVADRIPPELKAIVEYLNEQMTDTQVLAVEVRQYQSPDGLHRTIVPTLLGDTEAAKVVKGNRPTVRWDRPSLLRKMEEKAGAVPAEVLGRLFAWADGREALTDWYGSGKEDGSWQAGQYRPVDIWPFAVYTYGRVEVKFTDIAKRPSFEDPARLDKLREQLVAIPGVTMLRADELKRPAIDLAALAPADAFARFTGTMDWVFATVAGGQH